MSYRTPNPDYFPDEIDNKGRWFRDKDGTMYKAIVYEGGSVYWESEGTVLYTSSGPYRLKYKGLEKFWDFLKGGPLGVKEK